MICETCYKVNFCTEQRGLCTSYRNKRDEAIARAKKELEYAMSFKSESVNIAKASVSANSSDEGDGHECLF